jgi:hypothetical protein
MNSIRIPRTALAPAAALLVGFAPAAAHTPPKPRLPPGAVASRRRPLAACREFLQLLADRARSREVDARTARDLGLPPCGASGAPLDAFLVDPRPLWGIGLTPMPMAAPRPPHDAWSGGDATGHSWRRHPHRVMP